MKIEKTLKAVLQERPQMFFRIHDLQKQTFKNKGLFGLVLNSFSLFLWMRKQRKGVFILNKKQKELQARLEKIKAAQKKIPVQTGKKIQAKGLKHATKAHTSSQHYTIGFS